MSFSNISSNVWHPRLGDPRNDILQSLRTSLLITCPEPPSLFHSCIFGKQIKLLFFSSDSHCVMPFDIINCDLWTSPVFLVISIIFFFLIIIQIFCGHLLSLRNLKPIKVLLIFERLFSHNLAFLL